MSDELDTAAGLATHVGAPGVVGAITAWLTNFFRANREEKERTARGEADKALAVMLEGLRQKMDQLINDVRDQKQVFETVVITKQAVETLGQKLDDLRERVSALEDRPRRRGAR